MEFGWDRDIRQFRDDVREFARTWQTPELQREMANPEETGYGRGTIARVNLASHPVVASLTPVFLLIALGYFAGRRDWIRESAVRDLSNLVFLLLIPALLFRTMSGVHVETLDLRPLAAYFPAALLLPVSPPGRALMIGAVLLTLIVELVNGAIEAVVDRISLEDHPLAKRAKDVGSAAVFVSLVNVAAVWLLVLFG